MKRAICFLLSCVTALTLFTGCADTMFANRRYNDRPGAYDWNGNGNVSTSRDGTVNGGERSTARSRRNPHAKISGKAMDGR